jgi:GTP pyrophosphokinase
MNTDPVVLLPEKLEEFIKGTLWTFAKTYARKWPHEYIVREKVDQVLFDELAAYIDGHGYESHFYDRKQIYFDHAGHTYWHMDNIINRCPEADTYHRREAEGRLPKTETITNQAKFPWPEKPWLLSGRFVDALEAAAAMFADKDRKKTGIPYISHLLGTCAIALQNGANEDQAIAALLHDVIEDINDKDRARAIVGLFGPEVSRIVEACSDTDKVEKEPWIERKERYLKRLPLEDQAVLLVSASDKLDNARAIVADLKTHGPSVWDRFNAPRDKQLWYYGELVRVFEKHLKDKSGLLKELKEAVAEMSRLGGGQ